MKLNNVFRISRYLYNFYPSQRLIHPFIQHTLEVPVLLDVTHERLNIAQKTAK
jgi:hypothetical protein